MYLCKFQNIFVQIVGCICANFKASKYICPVTIHKVCLLHCSLPPSSRGFYWFDLRRKTVKGQVTVSHFTPHCCWKNHLQFCIIWHTCFHDSTMHIFALCKHFWNAPLEVHLQSYTAHICTSFKLFRRQCVRQNWHCVSACAQSWHTQHRACYLPGSRGCWRIYKEMSTLAPGQVTLANNMPRCQCANNRPKAPVKM